MYVDEAIQRNLRSVYVVIGEEHSLGRDCMFESRLSQWTRAVKCCSIPENGLEG